MHFDFLAEGCRHDLNVMEEWLGSRTFGIPVKLADGTTKIVPVAGSLRPRRFYTYVFPREGLDQVLNTLKPDDIITRFDNRVKNKLTMGKYPLDILRRAMRLKKVPKPDASKGSFPMVRNHVRILGVGIRDDVDFVNEKGNTQEGI